MKIGIDLDGVVVDMLEMMMPYLRKYKPNAKREDVTDYKLRNFGTKQSRTAQIELAKMLSNFEFNGGYLNAKPIDGAVEGVNNLYDKNEIHFISSRNQYEKILNHSFRWLNSHGFKYHSLTCFQEDKYPTIKMHGVELMIEDNPFALRELTKKGVECIVFDQPYNQEVNEIKRCKDWKEVCDYLK